MSTLSAVLAAGVAKLNTAAIEGAARDARALLAGALGLDPTRITLEAARAVSEAEARTFDTYLARRIAREPVARILGSRAFWGREFVVTPDVLDPRGDTETLIATALEGQAPASVLDLGTGSGAIAVSLLAEWPNARATATDISKVALAVAARNAERHGVSKRLDFLLSDWFGALEGRYDLIVSNPPYIAADEMAGLMPEVRNYDPKFALSPGGDGLAAYRIIAANADAHLATNGRLIVEIGHKQGAEVAQIFSVAGLQDVRIVQDLEGRDRVVVARR